MNSINFLTFFLSFRFPLDEHKCKFMVGSTNYDDTRMKFDNYKLDYDPAAGNTVLDYKISIAGEYKFY